MPELEQKIRDAKCAAGLDPNMAYSPALFVAHLDAETEREFWHWQVNRVLDLALEGDVMCSCGEKNGTHAHGPDNPAPLTGARARTPSIPSAVSYMASIQAAVADAEAAQRQLDLAYTPATPSGDPTP